MTAPVAAHPVADSRISTEKALELLRRAPLAELMERAHEVRHRLHENRTYLVHSLNLNPTNICENRCDLCAFWREPDAADAYLLSLDAARERLLAARELGLTDLHIVGGVTPALDLDYYVSLIRMARDVLPGVLVQGLTAVEIHYLARQSGLPLGETLRRLRDAGLGALPGGGAEIFAPAVRKRICPHKISAAEWLAVHEQAHALGLPTNATMLFGHVEAPEDIVDHLAQLRAAQDRTGGFLAFVPLPFHVDGTRLPVECPPRGHTIARVTALARIFLDNVPHIRALANYMDRKLLHALLHGGVDDVGGTSVDERIARAAGAPEEHRFDSVAATARELRACGLDPCFVNSAYQPAAERNIEDKVPCAGPAKPGAAESNEVSPLMADALRKAEAGERLSFDEAVLLHDRAGLGCLGRLAHRRRLQAAPGDMVTFVMDRNIALTNVCESGCRFCAFHVAPGAPGGFALSVEQIVDQVVESAGRGATQVMLQGGLNPALDLAFYLDMFSRIKERVAVTLHSLSPAEVLYLARQSGLSLRETLQRLRQAGLDSLPGGGAEILVEDVRRRVSPHKISAAGWLEVMRTAHDLGLKTTATMVYGLGETSAQRVEHLLRIRELQDLTGGFTAFIPWSFQSNRTQLPQPPQTGAAYLRMVALARLTLDNVSHIQAGWVTEGPDAAQLALSFGADDFGGILMEERVVRATGVSYPMTASQVISLIQETGMIPAQRATQYEILHTFPPRQG